MHVQSGANYIDGFGLKKFLNNSARGTLRRHSTQKLGYGIQPGKTPIDTLYSTLRLHTHAGRFKGRGCLGTHLLSSQLTILLAGKTTLLRHSAGSLGCLAKSLLDPHMQGKINVKIEIKQRDEFNQISEEESPYERNGKL